MGSAASITSEEQSKVAELVRKIRYCTGTERITALEGIFNLAKEDSVKLALCQSSTGLVEALIYTLRQSDDSFARSWAVSVIGRLSASVRQNKESLSSPELGLVPELMKLIHIPDVKDNIYVFFGNCIINTVTHPYLMSAGLGFVKAAKTEIESNSDYKFVFTFFANAVTVMSNEYANLFISYRIHEIIMNRLIRAGPVPSSWPDRNTGSIYRSLGFITSFSTLPDGRKALRELNKKSFFQSLLTCKEKERMNATIIMANLYGRDEGDFSTQCLLQTYPDILQLLVNLLAAIMNYDSPIKEVEQYKEIGLAFGVTKMRDASSTLRSLSLSDGNKSIMLKLPSFLDFVIQAVQLYLDDAPECTAIYQGFQSYAGGGGNDSESIENFMELLLQLTFHYDDWSDEKAFQEEFNRPKYQLIEKCLSLLNLPEHRKFPFEARQFTLQLLNRLQPSLVNEYYRNNPKTTNNVADKATIDVIQRVKSVKIFESPSAPLHSSSSSAPLITPSKGQHVMLSYSWNYKKAAVVEFGKRLRSLGYDVWRDEDGSTLVEPMSGDIVETMANAVQNSCLIIIFVSKDYKDSTNCRSEAKFARARAQSHQVKIFYVMLDKNYTTASSEAVDGWLGFMIGSEKWYPLWDSSTQLDDTLNDISGFLGDNARIRKKEEGRGGKTVVPQSSLPSFPHSRKVFPIIDEEEIEEKKSTKSTKSTVPSAVAEAEKQKNYSVAWNCLVDSKNSSDSNKLQGILDEYGLYGQDELELLDQDQLEALVSFLKPVQQKKFKNALNI